MLNNFHKQRKMLTVKNVFKLLLIYKQANRINNLKYFNEFSHNIHYSFNLQLTNKNL